MTCLGGATYWDGPLTTFDGTYQPSVLLQLYGAAVPGAASLGAALEKDPMDGSLWLGAMVVGAVLGLTMTGVLAWQCLTQCLRRTSERQPWQPGAYRLLAVAILVLLLAGLALPAWATGQSFVTTPLPEALRNLDRDATKLLTALNTSLTTVAETGERVQAELDDYSDEVQALVTTAGAGGNPSIQGLLTIIGSAQTALDDALELARGIQDTLVLPWETQDYEPIEEPLDAVWVGITAMASVMMVLLGGATSTLVLQAWHFHAKHQLRGQPEATPEATPDAGLTPWARWERQDTCCYNTTRRSLTAMAWLGLVLGVILATVLTGAADLAASACQDPHLLLDRYLGALELDNEGVALARYYLRANTDEYVYRCEFPLADDVADARAQLDQLDEAIADLAAPEAALRALVTTGGTTPAPIAARTRLATAASQLNAEFVASMYGVADASVISALVDHQLETLCNAQGHWTMVAALCYTTTVLVILALNVIVVVLRDERRGDKEDSAVPLPVAAGNNLTRRHATSPAPSPASQGFAHQIPIRSTYPYHRLATVAEAAL